MMNRQTGIAVLVLANIVIVVGVVAPLLPTREERFSELGILGPNMKVGGYPRSTPVNQSFLLYGFVANHEGIVENYQLMVKLGNQSTLVTNATYAVATLLTTYWHILSENATWLFPMNLTIGHAGVNMRVIFELWSYNVSTSSFAYTGLWNQVWMNVTLT